MGRLGLAWRAFSRMGSDAQFTQALENLLAGTGQDGAGRKADQPSQEKPPVTAAPVRSEAVTLLALLQREARLVDFLQESLDDYSNEQIGAAVRDVHRDSRAVIEKTFGLQPVSEQSEGQSLTVEAGFDPEQIRLTGNVSGQPPYQGTLRHHGWRVSRCALPQWHGTEDAATVVTPAEVECA